MHKNRIIKNVLIILVLSILMIPNYAKANSGEGFTSFNNAPRKYFTLSASRFADITMTIEDNNKIASVELYQVNSKGGSQQKVTFSSSNSNTKNSKKHIYTLSHENMLKGKSKYYYIKIKDGTGNIFYSYFKVVAKTTKVNGKEVSYYVIDDGPRVVSWKANKNIITFEVKDNVGTKYVKIQDGNNSNKQIYKYENLKAGSIPVNIDINKFKAVNGIYKVRIVAIDSGANAQKSTRTVYFKIPEESINNNNNNDNNNSNNSNNNNNNKVTTPTTNTTAKKTTTKNKNVSSFIASLDKISKQVQKDYKAGKKWKYTNGIHSENKLPFKYTFASALKTNTRNTNCADYVMWALHECGIFKSNQKFYGNNSGGITYKKNSKTKVEATLKKYATITKVSGKTPAKLIKKNKIKKGDILLYKGHTNVYAGNKKFYDAGRRKGINGYGTNSNYTFKTLGPMKVNISSTMKVTYIIRLKDQS